ncbi:MAG: 50S ribosomal protein L25 [Parcubacteria group bacterium QH_9_35_7]|nr:MAG: 50S ribosomal protein L25 [Parcubacteria group bacterium QH_9_35_7]
MSYSITVNKRENKDPQTLREEGHIPAVVYGPDIESTSISVGDMEFRKLFKQAGVSNLVDMEIEDGDESMKVLIQDMQYDPVKNNVIHADFKQIPMGEELEANIPIEFVGTAPAVKAHGGVLLKELEELQVKCLPDDLVDHIEVDLSQLEEIDDTIFVRDLNISDDLQIVTNEDQLVAKVSEVTVEEFEEEEEEGMTIEDVEVEGEEVPEEELEELEEGEEVPKEEEVEADEGEETEESPG